MNIESIGRPEWIFITFACFAIFLGIVVWGMRDNEKRFPWRGVTLCAVGVCLVWAMMGGCDSVIQPRRDPVTPPTFSLSPGQMQWYRLDVGGNTGRVVGRFEASGGLGNDVRVILASADEFENWRNGHAARVLYQSGQTTVGNLNVPLSPGVYYLAFDNRFSIFSGKLIVANIVLHH